MKRQYIILIAFLLSIVLTKAENTSLASSTSQLPYVSKQFISQHFGDSEIAHIVIEKKLFIITGYEVFLTNGVDIEFDRSGMWTEIDGNHNEIPEALIPTTISTYISRNYAKHKITTIEKESYGFQIQLNNGVELLFDRKGNFKGIDD